MRAYLDHRCADVVFTHTIKVRIDLEPGIWVVRERDGKQYAVTSVQGLVDDDGNVHLSWPRGVPRRLTGHWGAQERVLLDALPKGVPDNAWAALPADLRELLQDAYDLARETTPHTLGART